MTGTPGDPMSTGTGWPTEPAPAPAEPAVAEPVAAEPEPAAVEPALAVPVPAVPVPTPAQMPHHAHRPAPPPAAPRVSPPAEDHAAVDEPTTDEWGRVDDDGTVYVRTPDGERPVGSWQVGEPAQALAFYRRRYDALVVEVDLLERRIRAGTLGPDDAEKSMRRTRKNVDTAQAVGDLTALAARLDGLRGVVDARRAKRKAERAKAQEAARGTKESIAIEAEAIAAGSDWRAGADRLRALLDQWKALPRLEKAVDEELWHRFSGARTTYTRRRKAHFSELSDRRDDAKTRKEKLVTEAVALSTSTDWGPTAGKYRTLMSEWRAAGPAPRKEEELLWQQFRAAQDAFFAARSATFAERDSAEREGQRVKEQLLVEAEALLPVKDLAAAKSSLRSIEERWSAAGKVPRDAMASLEARLRTVEETVRAGDQAQWQRTSPAALGRAEETVAQLRSSIEALERQLHTAESAGNPKKADDARAALETRRSWLVEAEKTLTDLRR